jgi:hypothetical protein
MSSSSTRITKGLMRSPRRSRSTARSESGLNRERPAWAQSVSSAAWRAGAGRAVQSDRTDTPNLGNRVSVCICPAACHPAIQDGGTIERSGYLASPPLSCRR